VGLAGRVHQSGWDSFDAGGSDADQIEGALLSMLIQGEDVEAHALKERGWAISAIARHLKRDRKTVRSYLNGDRQPGVRVTVVVDAFAEFRGLYALAGEGHAPTDVTPPDRLVERRRAVRAGQDLVPSAASRTAPPPSVGADSVAEPNDSPAIALLKDRHRASAS
jgi:hypothetical protein